MSARFAYYDRQADIAWLPTGESASVVSEEVSWGLIDHDSTTDEVVAIEVLAASKRLPPEVLATLPMPARAHGVIYPRSDGVAILESGGDDLRPPRASARCSRQAVAASRGEHVR